MLLAVICCGNFGSLQLHAQINTYTFTQTTGTYSEITGGTVVATATGTTGAASLDDVVYNLPTGTIPFNFSYNGSAYTGCNISTNGFITFGTTAPAASGTTTGYTPLSATTAYAGAVSPAGRNLNAYFFTGVPAQTGQIRWQTLGTSPNRVFVIQWKNFKTFNTSGTTFGPVMNFQIRLNEGTNAINFVYNFSGAFTSTTVQVGLRGATNGFPTNINNRSVVAASNTWLSSVAGTANTSTCEFTAAVLPPSGLTYTFAPSTCPAPLSPLATNITQNSAQLTWTSGGGNGTFTVEYGPAGFTQGNGTLINNATSGITVSGLTATTNYQFYIRQICGASGSSAVVGPVNFSTGGPGEDCATALQLNVATSLATCAFTTVSSGVSSNGPNAICSDFNGNNANDDKWYQFVAPAGGNQLVITTTAGTVNDWVMEVWSGCPGSGTLVECSDDVNATMPEITLCQNEYNAGQTYYIRIWTYSATATGTANLCVYRTTACPLPPVNDECITAIPLTVNQPLACPAAATTYSTSFATANTDAATCDAGTKRDVWFVFNTGNLNNIVMTINPVTATSLKAQLLFECGGFEIACYSPANGNYTFTGLNPQADYIIRVWSDSGAAGTFNICLADQCANPTATMGPNQTVCAGQTASIPITFTGVAPFTFTYRNNTTNAQTTITTSQNPYNLQLTPSATTGYTLLSMNDAACLGSVSGLGTATVTVVTPQQVSLSAFPATCVDDPLVTLTQGSPAGGVYSGVGVSGGKFNPAVGTQSIIYTVTFAPGCVGADTATFLVSPLPNVALNNLGSVCLTAAPFTLTGGTPLGGLYSGPGVSGNVFNPATAGLGTKIITYTYTSTAGCTNADTALLTVITCNTCTNPPAVSAGPDRTSCGGAAVTLAGSISGGANSIIWTTLGSGTFSPSAVVLTPTYTPSAADVSAGSVLLIATTNDPDGTGPCVAAKDTMLITFIPNASVTTISGISSVCTGQSGVLYSVTNQSGYNYSWSVPTGVTITSGQGSNSIVTTWSASAVAGNVSVVASNSCGSVTEVLTVTVNSAPSPQSVSGPSQVCLPQSGVNFSVPASAGLTYVWTVPSGVTITSGAGTSAITTTWSSSAVAGNVSVAISNACGSVNATKAVSIGTLPTTPVVSGSSQVCAGTSGVTFSTSAQSGVSYNWSVPAGVTISSGQGTNSISTSWSSSATSGNVSVAVTNNCGTVNGVRAVAVNTAPSATSVSGASLVCLPQNAVTYSIPAQTGVTYTWSVPAGVTIASGTGTNTITTNWASSALAGNISVTVTNSCGSVSASTPVSVGQSPSTPTVSGVSQLCRGATAVSFSITAQAGVTYNWTVPTGVTITSGQGTASISTSWGASAVSGNVSVSVANSCSTVTAFRSVTVNTAPNTPIVTGPATACTGATGLIYSVTAQVGSTYTWTVPSGVTISAGQGTNSITTNWGSTAVSGNVNVTLSNSCGNATGSLAVVISNSVSLGPISGQNPVCRPATGVIYSVASVTGASYTWVVPTGVTITAGQGTNSITTSWSSTSVTGTVSVTASTTCASSTASLNVTVRTAIPTAPTSIGGTTSACRGDVYTFTIARVSTADFYVWTPPPGSTINGSSSAFTTPDTFVVVTFLQTFNSDTLRVQSGNCKGISTFRTKAISRRTTAPGTPGALTGQSSGLCGVTSVTYSMPAVITGAISYTWRIKLAGALINGLPSPVTVPANQLSVVITYPSTWNGIDTIFVRSNNGCGSSTERSLRVISRPGQAGVISGPTTVCVNAVNQSYTTAAAVGATSYTWTVPSGITLASGQGTNTVGLNFNATAATRSISVVANNACGAGTSRSLSVTSQACPRLADGNNGITVLEMYPNPAKDLVTVVLQTYSAENMYLTLTDISGRSVLAESRSFQEGLSQFNLDVSSFSAGIYLLSLEGTSGSYKARLLIER